MPAMQNAHALIIGINNYHHIKKLPTTVQKDAADIYALLIDPSHCAYSSDNVDVFTKEVFKAWNHKTASSILASRIS